MTNDNISFEKSRFYGHSYLVIIWAVIFIMSGYLIHTPQLIIKTLSGFFFFIHGYCLFYYADKIKLHRRQQEKAIKDNRQRTSDRTIGIVLIIIAIISLMLPTDIYWSKSINVALALLVNTRKLDVS